MEAWERYTNRSYTCDDLALIFDSIMDDDQLQEFDEVARRKWDMTMSKLPPTPEERKEIYRKKAVQLLAEYENRKKAQELQKRQISSGNFRKIWYAAAAVLLLGLLIPAAYLYMKPTAEQTVQYVEEITGRGEIKTVFLPDQTEVTLNAESHIKYPVSFTGNERSVELAGEALFDVTSDPTRPFTVKTKTMNIKVVGTVFDVKEYADDLIASVLVASGKVEVGLVDEKVMLGQNQQLRMDRATGNFEKQTIDASKYLSWTNGTLYFHRTPIREVVNILNRHYPQVDIELADAECSYQITGKHERVYIEDILKTIVYTTGLKCKKNENKYVLYSEE